MKPMANNNNWLVFTMLIGFVVTALFMILYPTSYQHTNHGSVSPLKEKLNNFVTGGRSLKQNNNKHHVIDETIRISEKMSLLRQQTLIIKDKFRRLQKENDELMKEVSQQQNTTNKNKYIDNKTIKKVAQSTATLIEEECTYEIPNIVLDFEEIVAFDKEPIDRLTNFTREDYVKYMTSCAGVEHYALLSYISHVFHTALVGGNNNSTANDDNTTYYDSDCHHFADIGTKVVTSALALASNLQTPIWTFDLADNQRATAFRGKSEMVWQRELLHVGANITFFNLDLLTVSDDQFKRYIGDFFVFLDTAHLPYSNPFEVAFFQRVLNVGFKGILLLAGIKFNPEMKRFWTEVQNLAYEHGFTTYDITRVGHWSGAGLVDFSGKVTIREGSLPPVPSCDKCLIKPPPSKEMFASSTPKKDSSTLTTYKIHFWDDGTYCKVREELQSKEGFATHPQTSLVDTPEEADIIVWVSTRARLEAENPPQNYTNVVLLDYADNCDTHPFKGRISNLIGYFKRSFVRRKDGIYDGNCSNDENIYPYSYSGAGGLINNDPHKERKLVITNTMRDHHGKSFWNESRERILGWTKDFVKKHGLEDKVFVAVTGDGGRNIGWDKTYNSLLGNSKIIVTANPSVSREFFC